MKAAASAHESPHQYVWIIHQHSHNVYTVNLPDKIDRHQQHLIHVVFTTATKLTTILSSAAVHGFVCGPMTARDFNRKRFCPPFAHGSEWTDFRHAKTFNDRFEYVTGAIYNLSECHDKS